MLLFFIRSYLPFQVVTLLKLISFITEYLIFNLLIPILINLKIWISFKVLFLITYLYIFLILFSLTNLRFEGKNIVLNLGTIFLMFSIYIIIYILVGAFLGLNLQSRK